MNNLPKIILKKNKEKLPLNRHPWIFSGAVQSINSDTKPGDLVVVYSANGQFVGQGHIASPEVSICVRLLSWDESEDMQATGYEKRIQEAVQLRLPLLNEKTNACRLIYSESDMLSGLIVDLFNDVLVLQCNTLGFDRIKKEIAQLLLKHYPHAKTVYEKSDSEGRRMEKLSDAVGVLAGAELDGTEIEILENGLKFGVDLESQKTGFYTDQRENRQIAATRMQSGMDILDVCCYSGAFAIQALARGAKSVTLIDGSQDALNMALKNIERNGFDLSCVTAIKGNMFDVLRKLRQEGKKYDFVVLDPPKLVRNQYQVSQAQRSYKDLNFQAIQLLKSGGYLASFSCSGNLSAEALQTQIAYAAKDAQKCVQILNPFMQGSDHPVLTSVPESLYLKGFLCCIR